MAMRRPDTRLMVAGLGLRSLAGILSVGLAPASHSFRQITIMTGKDARLIAVADINADGKPDLVVANADAETVRCVG